MEMDLAQLPNSGDPTLYAAFLNSMYLREIRVNTASPSQSNLTDEGFPDLARLYLTGNEETEHPASYLMAGGIPRIPACDTFDYLRVVELTGSKFITDVAIDRLIRLAPKLRQLALTKCEELTDMALGSVARLGKNLHHIHLGHVAK